MSTCNICFRGEIRKIFCGYPLLSVAMRQRLCCPHEETLHPWLSKICPVKDSDRTVCLFVCVEVLLPSQPNGVMSSAVSLPNHTFTGQALSSKRLTSIVHIFSPETDNCPS